jgi:phospholipid/cholesterol/gamma-HCH transport system substrate-binding protein
MENRAHALAAGLFILLLGAAAVAAVWWFSGGKKESVPYLLVSHHSVTGLSEQSAVRLRGVEVGSVESVRFDPQNPHTILVRIGVDPGTPISQKTYAQVGYQGITGRSYVRLDDSGGEFSPLPTSKANPARIELRPSIFEQLGMSGEELLASATEIADRLKAILSDKNAAQVTRTMQNIELASERIAALATGLEPAARDLPAAVNELKRSLEGVPALIKELKATIAGLPQTLQGADELIANLNGLTLELAAKTEVLDRVAASAERMGAAGEAAAEAWGRETMPRLNALLSDLSSAARKVEGVAAELRSQPQSLVFGKRPPPGPGEAGFAPPARGGE